MPLLASTLSWVMLLGGITLAIVILMRRYLRHYRRGKRRSADTYANRTKADKLAGQPLADAPSELLRWQVEMHETARDLKAEIDSKLSALQALIALAEQASARLESALEETRQQTNS